MQEAGVNPEQNLGQFEFLDAYKKVALAVAKYMREKPMSVAHTEKVFDGTSISNLLKDKHALDLVCCFLVIPSRSLGMEFFGKCGSETSPVSWHVEIPNYAFLLLVWGFLQALDLAWEIMPKTGNGSAPKSYLRVGLDTLAPYAGLPPVGAVPEVRAYFNHFIILACW
jgi:hypothetical protein